MNLSKKWLLAIGIFLILDGVLSLHYGKFCLNSCMNNSDIGNLVRYIRTIIGGVLVYSYFDSK
jgi:hypothetical protein